MYIVDMYRYLKYSLVLFIVMQSIESNSQDKLGHFIGNVHTEWDDNGREMVLSSEFIFVDPSGKRWTARKGARIDGASIPKPLWSVIGGPFEGKYRKASVVHDVYCGNRKERWTDVHKMFYEACLAEGLDNLKAKIMYAAVYIAGPRWDQNTLGWESSYKEIFIDKDLLIEDVKKWIEQENPTVYQIQSKIDGQIFDLYRDIIKKYPDVQIDTNIVRNKLN